MQAWVISWKEQTLSAWLVPAFTPPSMSCPLLYHNVLFFFFFFPQKVFHTGSRDLKDRGFGEVHGLPRKEGDLWKKSERRQTLPQDQQNPRSCGKLTAPSQRCGKQPRPQAQAAF